MKQKTKKLFSRLISAPKADMMEQKQLKIEQTNQFLAGKRAQMIPQAPIGFKPRSSSAYFFSNYR